MNPFQNTRTLALVLTLSAATLLSSASRLSAADDAPPAEAPKSPSARSRVASGGRGQEFARVLTDAQREQFRDAMIAQRESLRDLEDRLPRLRRAVSEATLADPLDETAVRQAARALAEAEADRTLVRARAIAKIRPSLSDDQVRQLRDMMAEPGVFLRPFAQNAGGPGSGAGPDNPARPPREGSDLPPPRRSKPPAKTP